ncbi:hypothetical protein GF371_04655 [Candidatus Woesearchaeota archaeon]|nr:hypothetical protein [Candidatus Woesearchaeota archaeon]
MVFERIITTRKIIHNSSYSLMLGVLFTVIAFATSYVLFYRIAAHHFIGISTILFTVVLTLPTIYSLFKYETREEIIGKASFFQKNRAIIDFFIYFFIGVFITLFIIALMNPTVVFAEENLYGRETGINLAIAEKLEGIPPPPTPQQQNEIVMIFENNLIVMLICFALAFFYGSGALLILILNASVFASALARVILTQAGKAAGFVPASSLIACNLGIMFFHMIPEVGSYLLAAVAGGILSKAILREKESFSFKSLPVFKNSIILLVLAIIILLFAAIIEVKISKLLFMMNVCISYRLVILIITAAIVIGVILLEYKRKKH